MKFIRAFVPSRSRVQAALLAVLWAFFVLRIVPDGLDPASDEHVRRTVRQLRLFTAAKLGRCRKQGAESAREPPEHLRQRD